MTRPAHIDVTSALRLLAVVLIALVMSAFVAAPSVEAATCAPGSGSYTAVLVAAPPSLQVTAPNSHDEAGSPLGLGGACAHGHCHHGTASTPERPVAERGRLKRLQGGYVQIVTPPPPSSSLPLPDQPPRV